MFNPFEKETLRWYLFDELAQTLDDEYLTPLEVAEIVNKAAKNDRTSPPRPSVEL